MRLAALAALVAAVGFISGCCNSGYQHFIPRPTWGPHSTGPVIHPDCPHCRPTPVGRAHDHCCGELNMSAAADMCHTCNRPKSAPRGNCSCDCHTGY